MKIPNFQLNGNLPAGIHLATWQEIEETLAFNDRRQELLSGLKRACIPLKQAGCRRIYIGGSFVTQKEFPGDFDFCWEEDYVDQGYLQQIDPVFFEFANKRAAQKAKYGGEFFPAQMMADFASMKEFFQFFQEDKLGNLKGIVAIDL